MIRPGPITVLLACLAWAIAATPAVCSDVAVRNGGFEELGPDGFPVGWHFTKATEPIHEEGGNVKVEVAEGMAHGGDRCVMLTGDFSSFPCFLDQDLTPEGKGPLPPRGTISFWYRILEGTVQRPAVTCMAVNPEHRDYPGGFFVPLSFASDGAWHYAEMGYDLSHGKTWSPVDGQYYQNDSATVRIYLMSFESFYPARTKFLVDDVQFHPQDPVYFAPRLFHVVETGDPMRFEARLYTRNMALRPATGKFEIQLPSHLQAEGSPVKTLELPAGHSRGLHSSDTTGAGMIKWIVSGARSAGDRIAVKWIGEPAEKSWTWSRELKPALEFEEAHFSRGLIGTGDRALVEVTIKNKGHAPFSGNLDVGLIPSSNLETLSSPKPSEDLQIAPGESVRLNWMVSPSKPGRAAAKIQLGAEGIESRLTQVETWVDDSAFGLKPGPHPEEWGELALVRSGPLILSLGSREATLTSPEQLAEVWRGELERDYGPFGVYFFDGHSVTHLASAPYLGKVIYLINGNEVEKTIRYEPAEEINQDSARLASEWTDEQGARWRSSVLLRSLEDHPGELEVTSTLQVDTPRKLSLFQGPHLLVGDGSSGLEKDSAQRPGIDWLIGEEKSSDQSNIVGLRDQRVPHPNKLTVPVMGFVVDRKMVGLTWDPLQKWDGRYDRPSALFDSPNRTHGQANHLAGLFLPSIPDWVEQYKLKATTPYPLEPGKEIRLQFSIFAADNASDLSPVLYWHERHGTPEPPALDRTYEQELALCETGKAPEMNVESAIRFSLEKAELALAKQADHGWWPWSYSGALVTNMLNWTHSENIDDFGMPGDTSIGAYSPDWQNRYDNLELFRAARFTGDPRLVERAVKALRKAESFRRPEGAQPWELPLHTADILAARYGVDAFLEGYLITGNEEWLEKSRYWARAGLPFIYVWEAEDQPKMKYAAIAVYGGSFTDYLLLGQGITWCAMDYAESLIHLAAYDPEGPWKTIALGIIHNVTLQHEMEGEKKGMWPDWRDLTKNRVLANVWYKSPRVGEMILKWQGKDPLPRTKVIPAAENELRVTADGKLLAANYADGLLRIELEPVDQPVVRLAIAGVEPFDKAAWTASAPAAITDVSYLERYAVGFARIQRGDARHIVLEARVRPVD